MNQTTCAQPTPFCVGGTCECNETLCGGNTCTTLNTTSNCSACGDSCTATNASTDSCNGTTCSYTCNAGASDCNKGTVPDVDGCECATPGCCGTGCETTHVDGLGQSFYDCSPLRTYTDASAMEACTAYAPTVGGTSANCSPGWSCGSGAGEGESVCYGDTSGTTCTKFCWVVTATPAPPGSVTSCSSCNLSSGTWN